ncbi:MAG: ORF6N domain-containing protein [Coprococcus sp.]|nr:ORF6N domain-containing protein [Lachnospiraceae bacterium]
MDGGALWKKIKRNIERFQNDMMFQLSDDEVEYLRSQFVTANISSKSRSNPYVFTEQGVYMLMTVLKGELAVRQSIVLVRTFKKMKDYILENRDLIGQREMLQLSMETANNRIEINKINSDMISLEKQISDVAEGLKDVITKSELADMMNSFVSDDDEKVFLCGASSKDAGARITSIVEEYGISKYAPIIATLLKNPDLILPQ